MKVHEIHKLIDENHMTGWEYGDAEGEEELLIMALEDAYNRAQQDVGALYTFLTFAASLKGADYNWTPKKFTAQFTDSFKSSGDTAEEALITYFQGMDFSPLSAIASDPLLREDFNWSNHVDRHRRDLTISPWGGKTYVFGEV